MLGYLISKSDVALVLFIESYSLRAYCELHIVTSSPYTVVSGMGKTPVPNRSPYSGERKILL